MISIKNLVHRYTSDAIINFPDWNVPDQKPSIVLGESGCGKTTLLQLMGGLLPIEAGEIRIKNIALEKLSRRSLRHHRGNSVGFVFQANHLIQSLNVKQNILLSNYFTKSSEDHLQLDEILGQLNIEEKKNSLVSSLSMGQRQRVAIARALYNKPEIVLADEPTSSLDDSNCDQVMGLLFDITEKYDTQLVVTTHDNRIKNLFDYRLMLNKI